MRAETDCSSGPVRVSGLPRRIREAFARRRKSQDRHRAFLSLHPPMLPRRAGPGFRRARGEGRARRSARAWLRQLQAASRLGRREIGAQRGTGRAAQRASPMRQVKIPAFLVAYRWLRKDLFLQPLKRTELIGDSLAQGRNRKPVGSKVLRETPLPRQTAHAGETILDRLSPHPPAHGAPHGEDSPGRPNRTPPEKSSSSKSFS